MSHLDEAMRWYELGWTPLPLRTDGSKAPARSWRDWQQQRPSREQVTAAFAVDHDGFGVLTGTPRPDGTTLLMIEAEGRAVREGVVNDLAAAMAQAGLADLWARITGGYAELTPSLGIHWYAAVAGPCGRNAKLASRPATEAERAEHPNARVQVLLETRGEGGFTVVAPSAGRSHPTGGAWRAIVGTPETIPTIDVDELERLLNVARSLDQMPAAPHAPTPPAAPPATSKSAGVRPGDDFAARTSWADILGPHGWQVHHTVGQTTYWTRPGKGVHDGASATTGHSDDGVDRLFVFSTSTTFEAERPYDKLGALAVLEHGGDLGAAVKALAEAGYGHASTAAPSTPKDPFGTGLPAPVATVTPISSAPSAPRTEGSTALAAAPETDEWQPVTDLDLARFGRTEDGVAQAFVARFSDQLRYCPQRGLWLAWNGSRWAWDEGELHRELARRLARALPDNDAWKKFRAKVLSAAGISGVIRLARTDPAVTIHIDELDSHPWELNTPAGAIDMRTGLLAPADRTRLHTRSTTVTPDYESPSPVWDAFLRDTFGGSEDLVSYVQRLVGISAVGQVLEQQLPFAFGAGANGKSTLMNVVMKVMGRGRDGYSTALDSEALMVRRHSEHPAELAQLAGARLVVSSEIEDGHRFAEARVKQLTGGDAISARFMRGNPFTFTPSHTLWLIGNHKPGTSAGGPAFWRRIKLIPFEHIVPEDRRDPHLEDKLAAEAPQILAWIARGAADYYARGMGTPEVVTSATAAYRDDQDSVGKFVAEACMKTTAGRVKVADLRAAYERFCRDTGDAPVSAKQLGERLRDCHGVDLIKSTGGVRAYGGLTLYADADEPERSDWWDR